MDAAEDDRDIKVQKASVRFLADLQDSLTPLLWRTTASGRTRLRRKIPNRETLRLTVLLDSFQELPQLLDPHLDKFVPPLADALVLDLRARLSSKTTAATYTEILIPASLAVSKLVYSLCKVRGDKVIVRFLGTETKNLELLLSAIEAGDSTISWAWEERYVFLLWLSQLFLAPFDLSTISSANADEVAMNPIPGLDWPPDVPGVALRIIPIAIRSLASVGKERDAAKVLLVRLAMRKDMQEVGILKALVRWAISQVRVSSDEELPTYHYIGILSFLGAILVSTASTGEMDEFLPTIFQTVHDISASEHPTFRNICSSAVARKMIIKVLRAIIVIIIRKPPSMIFTDMIESTIGQLLEYLSDSATPVRLAASKALSIITLKLDAEMSAQVVEAVLDALNQNILWVERPGGRQRDLSAVNSLEWHGLIMTLSHQLYRQSPPASSLESILPALLLGLSFEQRSTSGSSVGTNVRDAACFGLWAMARRYSTDELKQIIVSDHLQRVHGDVSVLQILATELVVSASTDPAGNIRRGSSAALQELIGRHPDTIIEGIKIVQVVDYHAVALRSRALLEVAYQAAQLSSCYLDHLIESLLGWRGIGDSEPMTRRYVATSMANLIWSRDSGQIPWNRVNELIDRIRVQLSGLKTREVDERHGLILLFAAVSCGVKDTVTVDLMESDRANVDKTIGLIKSLAMSICADAEVSTYRRPELIAEAVSRLITAASFSLRIGLLLKAEDWKSTAMNQIAVFDDLLRSELPNIIGGAVATKGYVDEDTTSQMSRLLTKWLQRSEDEVIGAASAAACDLMLIMNTEERVSISTQWMSLISTANKGRSGQGKGLVSVLFHTFVIETSMQDQICEKIKAKWQSSHDILIRVAIMQSLAGSSAIHSHIHHFPDMIAEGLEDYTTNARGDIGSLVRIEAVKVLGNVWDGSSPMTETQVIVFRELFGKTLRLAVEKLDKVRIDAKKTVARAVKSSDKRKRFEEALPSSCDHYRFCLQMMKSEALLPLPFQNEWLLEMLEGYVTSADTGSEDIIRVSRTALAEFCDGESEKTQAVCETLVRVMRKNIANDRILVSTMETLSFLFDAGILAQSSLNWRSLYILTQKAHYKTGNVKKLEAAVKLYGGLVGVYPEALDKLSTMILHPFPTIRSQVADTLFAVREVGKGVNWYKADKHHLQILREELGLGTQTTE